MARKGKGVRSLRAVMPSLDEADDIVDSVSHAKGDGSETYVRELLLRAQRCWDSMDAFRKNRLRAKNYCYGKQWEDKIDIDGTLMTEEEYIRSQKSVPMTNNLIRRLVKNVLGAYRNQNKEPGVFTRDRQEQTYGEVISTLHKYAYQLNKKGTLSAKQLEDALIGGMVAEKKTAGWRQDRGGKFDVWSDKVQMDMFFVDSDAADVFLRDARIVGEIHDWSFAKVCSAFAKSRDDVRRLKQEYASCRNREELMAYHRRFGEGEQMRDIDFLCPDERGMCRVIEVWVVETREMLRCWDKSKGETYIIPYAEKANVDAENRRRVSEGLAMGMDADDVAVIDYGRTDDPRQDDWFVQEYWYYRFLTPFGHVLQEGETPYAHGEHPYVMFAYPFIDGEIHSFVSDVIDQQRYINRLITMYDWIMRCSAKGLLLAPEGAFDGQDIDKVAETWSSFNGVLMYKPKPGYPAPQQVSGNMTNTGISEMLSRQLDLMEDVSGVNGAMQGKKGYSQTSGALYAQQAQNGSTSLVDLLECFSDFEVDCSYKDVKNILQFYDDKRIAQIVGQNVEWKDVDIDRVRNVEYDISIVESSSSPVYRQVANDFLMQLLQMQKISVEQLLETGDFPFADKLLQSIQAQQERLQQDQQQTQGGGQQMSQVPEGAQGGMA